MRPSFRVRPQIGDRQDRICDLDPSPQEDGQSIDGFLEDLDGITGLRFQDPVRFLRRAAGDVELVVSVWFEEGKLIGGCEHAECMGDPLRLEPTRCLEWFEDRMEPCVGSLGCDPVGSKHTPQPVTVDDEAAAMAFPYGPMVVQVVEPSLEIRPMDADRLGHRRAAWPLALAQESARERIQKAAAPSHCRSFDKLIFKKLVI